MFHSKIKYICVILLTLISHEDKGLVCLISLIMMPGSPNPFDFYLGTDPGKTHS